MTTLTAADRALDLFRHPPGGGDRLAWLANQLLALAGESGSLSLRVAPAADGPVVECADAAHAVRSGDPGPLRLFRTVLARLAKMAADETGAAFDPYGGELRFDRPSPAGPVSITARFCNTTAAQSLTLTRAD